MRFLLFTCAALTITIAALITPATAQIPSAEYEPTTGGITFFNVVDIIGLRVDGDIHTDDGFTCEELSGVSGGAFFGATCFQQSTFVEWGNLLGFNFDDEFAGNVLPANLTQADIDSEYVFRYRTLTEPGEDRFSSIRVVPEPTTAALFTLGLIGLISTRRCRFCSH